MSDVDDLKHDLSRHMDIATTYINLCEGLAASMETIMVVCQTALQENPSFPEDYYKEIIEGAAIKAEHSLKKYKDNFIKTNKETKT